MSILVTTLRMEMKEIENMLGRIVMLSIAEFGGVEHGVNKNAYNNPDK